MFNIKDKLCIEKDTLALALVMVLVMVLVVVLALALVEEVEVAHVDALTAHPKSVTECNTKVNYAKTKTQSLKL